MDRDIRWRSEKEHKERWHFEHGMFLIVFCMFLIVFVHLCALPWLIQYVKTGEPPMTPISTVSPFGFPLKPPQEKGTLKKMLKKIQKESKRFKKNIKEIKRIKKTNPKAACNKLHTRDPSCLPNRSIVKHPRQYSPVQHTFLGCRFEMI